MQYTTDSRIIRIMCTGRVDPTMISDAFLKGADGLMVVGCHFGDCHLHHGQLPGKDQGGDRHSAPGLCGSEPAANIFRPVFLRRRGTVRKHGHGVQQERP